VSQLPVRYVPRALVTRRRRSWRLTAAPVAEWGSLVGLAAAALATAAAIGIVAVNAWK
jgi:ABC-type multidrug transport system permease subunit